MIKVFGNYVDILNKRIKKWCIMFRSVKRKKTYLNSNEMITKSMLKRRRLALSAISCIGENVQTLHLVK